MSRYFFLPLPDELLYNRRFRRVRLFIRRSPYHALGVLRDW